MESANFHHHQHQLQDQFVGSSSLSTPIPSTYAAGSAHAWTQNTTLYKNDALNPHLNSSMVHDLGPVHWTSNVHVGSFSSLGLQSAHDQQLSKIKEEASDSFPRFTEMLNGPSCIDQDSYLSSSSYIGNEHKDMCNLSEKLMLKTISSGFPMTPGHRFSPAEIYSTANTCSSFGTTIPSRGSFSQIYPSTNISNLNQSLSSLQSSSLDMNLQALDLLTSSRFSGSNAQTSLPNFGFGHIQQSSNNRPSCSPSKVTCPNELTETKRPNSLVEPKATQAAASSKKSRLESSRASCPPFKVRKEKLGDRIAALQQLVAPFGKTDTASVLMEAIGYIKFLQNQVETLSVPYMKSARNKNSRTVQPGSSAEDGNEETKRDLRSRGLCLVPLSSMSYVTSDGAGGGIWPPPNFGGGT
ncbi:hypothetical protein Tsubulata_033788 [Turnera subulata]|uniref:BHLH domain-containing protein n=1 Tax=Turnera subulata TaxID=218843 RepID=A0A9Q0F650_9ROSI|nr:hypothetical protein Tsubulata_033788 [Turnera subulata]